MSVRLNTLITFIFIYYNLLLKSTNHPEWSYKYLTKCELSSGCILLSHYYSLWSVEVDSKPVLQRSWNVSPIKHSRAWVRLPTHALRSSDAAFYRMHPTLLNQDCYLIHYYIKEGFCSSCWFVSFLGTVINLKSSEPWTLNLEPRTLNLEPWTLNLEPESQAAGFHT